MKVHVWNRTGLDLWSGMVVMNDVIRFVFRPWDSVTPNRRNLSEKLEAEQLGTWDVRDGFPIDPATGMVRARAHAPLPFKVHIQAHPKGWMGRDVFILAPDIVPPHGPLN